MRIPNLSGSGQPHHQLPQAAPAPSRRNRNLTIVLSVAVILLLTAFVGARIWARRALDAALPQLDGQLTVPGLSASVTVQRDARGIPHLRAASLDDLVFAQGFITAQDRLFQMDLFRRHASGELAEVLGPAMLPHDRIQRTLQLRATADRSLSLIPPDQRRFLEIYASGVNAAIAIQRPHLPLEFRLLRYQPAPWTARDSLLAGLAMFQDLTNNFPVKLNREALASQLPPELVADLYPVGSWRDHPPSRPEVDLTAPQELPDIPLDESQTGSLTPAAFPGASAADLAALSRQLAPLCEGCRAGSNNWAVTGTRTSTGRPMLSNDMHLSHSAPGIWYAIDLQTATPDGPFHAAGVALPGMPFVLVGHNAHIAWGFTNLGADVQDLFIEHLRGSGSTAEYTTPDGQWHPLLHQTEIIHVRGGKDVPLEVLLTQHGSMPTPIVSALLPSEKRPIALRWTLYDPSVLSAPLYQVNAASDWTTFLEAFSTFGGPAQNVVYADDQGHIGYHAVGRIPFRGDPSKPFTPQIPATIAAPAPSPSGLPAPPSTADAAAAAPPAISPTPISPIPVDALTSHYDWLGYIPFVALPQSFDPPGGVLATANARVTPDNYPYTITLNWAAPYRNERIWKTLTSRQHMTAADMLSLQTDVSSDLDRVIAHRLAYAIDHSSTKDRRLRQAADLMRKWNGSVDLDAVAPSIVVAARAALWELILEPRLRPATAASAAVPKNTLRPGSEASLYLWGEKSYAAEQIIMHTPARWLPPSFFSWDELLTAVVDRGLRDAKAPSDLARWRYGAAHPVEIEHPVYGQSALLRRLIDLPIGTGLSPQSGDDSTVKQVGHSFGPSERLTVDLSNLDDSTLNLVLGESGSPASPHFLDQWPAWYNGTTFPMPFNRPATDAATRHTLTLNPR